jgi:hypothetical protein
VPPFVFPDDGLLSVPFGVFAGSALAVLLLDSAFGAALLPLSDFALSLLLDDLESPLDSLFESA